MCCCGFRTRKRIPIFTQRHLLIAGQNLQNAAFSIKTNLQQIQNNEVVELASTAFFEWRACHADNALRNPTSSRRKSFSQREWWTSSAWRMEVSSKTGMSFTTKQHVKPPRLAFPRLATIPRLGTVSSHGKTRRKRTQNRYQITREIKSALQGERLRANQ